VGIRTPHGGKRVREKTVNQSTLEERTDIAGCPDAYPPQNPQDMNAMLNVLVEAERCAIRTYTEICHMTFGKDWPWLSCTKRWNTKPGSRNIWGKGLRGISGEASRARRLM
jgi:hypothetical protein